MKLFYTLVFALVFTLVYGQDQWLNFTNNYYTTDLVETAEGYWISSTGGLCYYAFDDDSETYYNRGNSEIPSNYIQDLWLDSNEELWLTTSLGISKYVNGTFEKGPEKIRGIMRESLDGKIIVANYDSLYIQTTGMNFESIAYPSYVAGIGGLEVDQVSGAIYFNGINYFAETFVAVYENEAWTILFSEFIYESSITLDHSNQLWFLTSSSLRYYENGEWIDIPESMEGDAYSNMQLHVNKDNQILIESYPDCPELLKWDGNQWKEIAFTKEDCKDCFFIKPSELQANLYFATNRTNGFYKFNIDATNDFQAFSQSPVFNNRVLNTLHTMDGRHYLIYHDRIQYLENGNWEEMLLPESLSDNIVAGRLDASDQLWIHGDAFLWYYENETWNELSIPSAITDNIQLITTGPNGEIWIQSKLNIARYQNGSWEIFKTIHHGISSSIIKDLQVDPANGDLWVTSFQGIRWYDGQDWTTINIASGNQIFKMAISNEGVFVRSSFGLYYIKEGMIDSIPLPEVGYYGPFESNMSYDLNEERLFLAGTNILAVYENEKWTTYSTLDAGIYNGFSMDVSLDAMGNLWLAGNEGGVSVFNATGVTFTAVEEEDSKFDWNPKIYPTILTNGQIFIESPITGEHQIIISDMLGRIMSTKNLDLHARQVETCLFPNLSQGVYLVTLSHGSSSSTQRLIQMN